MKYRKQPTKITNDFSYVLKRNLILIFFCLILSVNNILKAEEKINVPLSNSSSSVKYKLETKPDLLKSGQFPSDKLKTEIDKAFVKIKEREIGQQFQKQQSKNNIFSKLPVIFFGIFAVFWLILLFKWINKKFPKKKNAIENIQPVQEPVFQQLQPLQKNEKQPETISEAVASFVKQRLNKNF